MFDLAVFALSLVLLTVTVFARVRLRDWWLRACEFPRVQIACLAGISALLSVLIDEPWRTYSLAASIGVVVIQAWWIFPYTRLARCELQQAEPGHEERCVTLLIANVLTPNRNAKGLIDQILEHRPDIVLTLESDDWWGEQLHAALAEDWPIQVSIPQDNLYGMHLFSRLDIDDLEVKRLIQDDIPSIHGWVILDSGERVRLHALHPRPPSPQESETSLWRDAELLLVGREIREQAGPALLIGDLNDVAWSRTTKLFTRVSGMLDPRRGRGMFATFHAGHRLLRWPLDHIFVTEHFTLRRMQRLKGYGSDHFPILATLCCRPSRSDENDRPEPEQGDKAAASETIRAARAAAPQTV
ncbi:MAG: endonuclease/exonuclease/phosphatase family protein [Pseudomonas sp.]|nr:endonuclease/exonuclease/phosphatase family protein [Pseudomonas sp.]